MSECVYENDVAYGFTPNIGPEGAADLPIALLTGPVMPPEAVEIAATLRVAGRAWIVGEGLRIEVAESRWHGVGPSGVVHRIRDLYLPDLSVRLPDEIQADRRTADPGCVARELIAQGGIPDSDFGEAARPEVHAVEPFQQVQPTGDPLGDLRAGLVISHGAARTFYPYFETVGDILDERLMEVASALPVSPSRKEARDALRRLGNALSDGHNFVRDNQLSLAGFLAIHVENVDGAPVVRRSAAPGIAAGDTITSIGGVPAADFTATELARSGGAAGDDPELSAAIAFLLQN